MSGVSVKFRTDGWLAKAIKRSPTLQTPERNRRTNLGYSRISSEQLPEAALTEAIHSHPVHRNLKGGRWMADIRRNRFVDNRKDWLMSTSYALLTHDDFSWSGNGRERQKSAQSDVILVGALHTFPHTYCWGCTMKRIWWLLHGKMHSLEAHHT